MPVSLLEARTRVRQRSGHEHTQEFVTDDEIDQLINLKYKELYGLLVRHGLHRNEQPESIPATGALSYNLPADFWAVLAVFRQDSLSGNSNVYLTRHDHRVKPSLDRVGPANSYRITGATIEFDPVPQSGTYTLVYIPVPGELVDDADTMEGVLGWEEYVVVAVCIAIAIKDKVDTTDLRMDLGFLERRIVDEAKAAELSENPVVQDVRGTSRYGLPGDYGVRGYRGHPAWWYR